MTAFPGRGERATIRLVRQQGGFSLLESVIALSLLLIVSLGLLPLGVVATTTTENQGHLMARATEYAQDKMEQMLSLAYGDVLSDTRVFPAADTGGTGLALGGSSDPEAPVALYVDYLNIAGTLLPAEGTTAPANWYYKRVWEVESAGTNLKRITVTVKVKSAVGSTGRVPQATVASIKTYPF
jgi:prepilin-type N-terminal cleavage/methylation domain-containing protein